MSAGHNYFSRFSGFFWQIPIELDELSLPLKKFKSFGPDSKNYFENT